ncbi:low temperature requirement protein A [Streptomyces sp. NPDC093064]|uniref:low temperature requirement protein A n=1 Tax=Streptomyces sp. NPDC093064 TaxID=3366020 RepID=UPI0037F5D63D
MTSRQQHHARLRRRLWQPPRPHGERLPERVVGPLELFYDLVVVVLVAQAAHHLAGHLTWHGLGEFAAVFALVWIAWLNGSLHHEVHGHDDARSRIMFLLQILVLVPLGSFIPEAGGARGAAFAVDAGVLFAVLAVLWLLATRGDSPEFRRSSRLFVAGTAAFAVVLAASAALPAGARVLAWGLLAGAYLAGFAVMLGTVIPIRENAVTVTPALTERFGLLIIIVLGETVTGVVSGLAGRPANALTLAVGLVAVVVGFGAWWTYFDFAGHRPPRPARASTVWWMLAHLPLTAAVAAMGTAMVGLVEHAHDSRTPTTTAWVLCGGAATVLATTVLLTTSLQVWGQKRGLYRPLARLCAVVAAACLALGAARPAPLVLGLALVLLLGVPWSFAVAYDVAHEEGKPPSRAAREPPDHVAGDWLPSMASSRSLSWSSVPGAAGGRCACRRCRERQLHGRPTGRRTRATGLRNLPCTAPRSTTPPEPWNPVLTRRDSRASRHARKQEFPL